MVELKKYGTLIMIALFLGACSSGNDAIEDDQFIFSEEEFKEAYEATSDSDYPEGITISKSKVALEEANKEEAINFLEAFFEVSGDSDVKDLKEGIEQDEDDLYPFIMNDDMLLAYLDEGDGESEVLIYPFGEDSHDEND